MTITGLGGQSILAKMVSGGAPPNKVLADDGNLYDSVQTAENNATDTIIIGPGTFNEAVTVDTAGLTVVGSGYNTLIDGGTTGAAVTIAAADVSVESLSVQTTAGGGNNYAGIATATGGTGGTISGVIVRDSDFHAIRIDHGTSWTIQGCRIESSDSSGIYLVAASTSIVSGNIIQSNVGLYGVFTNSTNADDIVIVSNTINGVGEAGIQSRGNDTLIGSNRIHNSGTDGIEPQGTDQIIFNNRISGSTNNDINDAGTNTTLDANVTGAAN